MIMFSDIEFKYPLNVLYLLVAVAAAVFFILAFEKKEKIMASLLHLNMKAAPGRPAIRGAWTSYPMAAPGRPALRGAWTSCPMPALGRPALRGAWTSCPMVTNNAF